MKQEFNTRPNRALTAQRELLQGAAHTSGLNLRYRLGPWINNSA